MQLNIPVHQTITLPDKWPECKTPQELSYWLIAKLDGIQADVTNVSNKINSMQNTYVCYVSFTISDSSSSATVCFSYITTNPSKPTDPIDVYTTLINTNYSDIKIPSSGVFNSQGSVNNSIFAVAVSSNRFEISYGSAGTILAHSYETVATTSNFVSDLIPLIEKSDA